MMLSPDGSWIVLAGNDLERWRKAGRPKPLATAGPQAFGSVVVGGRILSKWLPVFQPKRSA